MVSSSKDKHAKFETKAKDKTERELAVVEVSAQNDNPKSKIAPHPRNKINPFAIDDETAPLTDDEIKRLRPAAEVFEELGLPQPKPRGRPKASNPKLQVTLRLDAEIVAHFKANGKGWQTRVNDALRHAIEGEAE